MDWSNERYVRLYTRDTTEWVVWGWEANSLFCLMLRKADRTGVIEVGKHGHRGLAALLRMPDEVVERALKTLLDSGTVEWAGTDLVIRNFIEAQEASMSPVQRQRESRYRRRDLIRQGIDPDARECAVYFLQSEDGGSVKIGRADDLAKRLSQLQTARPDKLVVLAAVKGTIEDERSVHDLFADIREKGEWFSPHPKLMAFVKAIASGESLAVTLSRDWSRFATGHSDPCLAVPSLAVPSDTAPQDAADQTQVSRKVRGHRLPDDWEPTTVESAHSWHQIARSRALTVGQVSEAKARFKDHWRAAAGQRGVKLDWEATWRNWLRGTNAAPAYRPRANDLQQQPALPGEHDWSVAARAKAKVV